MNKWNAQQLSAANKLALLEYKGLLFCVVVTTFGLLYYIAHQKPDVSEDLWIWQMIVGIFVAYGVKNLFLGRMVLKKYSEGELKQKWLIYGGFAQETSSDDK